MDDEKSEWYRENLGFSDDWRIDRIEHLSMPLRIRIHISHIDPARCPNCLSESTIIETMVRIFDGPDFGKARCKVIAMIPRVKCKNCGIRGLEPQ